MRSVLLPAFVVGAFTMLVSMPGQLPVTYLDLVDDSTNDWISIGRRGMEGLDTRARNIEVIENVKKDAVDYYARIRTLYRQNREDAIRNGELEEIPIPGLSEEDWNNPPAAGDASQQSKATQSE